MKLSIKHSISALIALAGSAASLQAQYTWTPTTAGTRNWTDPANWSGASVPPATATSLVTISTANAAQTIVLNTAGDQILQDGLTFTTPAAVYFTTPWVNTIDLNGKSLVLDGGTLGLWRSITLNYQGVTYAFSNGTFQLGTDDNAASINLGYRDGTNNSSTVTSSSNVIQFATGSTFDSKNVSGIFVAANIENFDHRYTLDLSAATLRSGDTLNALKVTGNIGVGAAMNAINNNNSSKNGLLKLGNLSLLEVGGDLIVGQSNDIRVSGTGSGTQTNTIIGEVPFSPTQGATPVTVNIGGSLRLGVERNSTGTITGAPVNLDLNIGSESTRGGAILVGYKSSIKTVADTSASTGSFTTTGGTFDAYITQLAIGVNRNTYSGDVGTATGTLDFSASTLGVLDISGNAEIGVGKGAVGTLRLAGGEASAVNLVVGNATGTATRSTLDLNETLWSLSGNATVGALGDVNITLENTAAGLEVAGVFNIATGGKVTATFNADATTESIWALKLAGDQQSLLNGYLDNLDGRLVGAGAFGANATVWQDGGFTYYGLQIPEPSMILLSGLGLAFLFARRKR